MRKIKGCTWGGVLSVLLGLSWGGCAEPTQPEESKKTVVFDVWNYFESENITDVQYQADMLYFLTSLQGIVNRDEPRLYLIAALSLFDLESKYRGTPEEKTVPVTELDVFWLEWMQQKGWVTPESIVRPTTLKELIACYQSEIGGLVQWDTSVGATLNAALMAAGAEDLLPVSDRLADGAHRNWLRETFPALQVKLDLSGVFQGGTNTVALDGIEFKSCGSAKNDVYHFAIERFMKPEKLDPAWMWYDIDGSIWSTPNGWTKAAYSKDLCARLGARAQFQHNGFYNADYWVSKRAIFLDLYPWGDSAPSDDPAQRVGEDLETWNDILELSYEQRDGTFGICGGFIPWWIKYTKAQGNPHDAVPGEHEFIALISSYNMANEGDAAFGIANASFFQHMPNVLKQDCQWGYPPPLTLEKGVTYIAFMMMDYDGSAWMNQAAVSIYSDPARGKIPLNWCNNPVLNERIPHAFQYMVENRTDLDFFGIENDGTGYISPYFLQEGKRLGRVQEDGLKEFETFARKLRERYQYEHNALYITSQADDAWLEMCARLNPEGFGVHTPSSPDAVDNAPVIRFKYYASVPEVVSGVFQQKLEKVYSRSAQDKPDNHFEAWRCILLTPTHITTAVEAAEKKYPGSQVKIVDWPNFLQLKKQSLAQ